MFLQICVWVFMRRLVFFFLSFCMAGFIQQARADTDVHRKPVIVVLTGSFSGVYYPVGNLLAKVFAQALPETRVVVQVTRGAVENLSLLQAGRGTVAPAMADVVLAAWRGNSQAGFTKSYDQLRVMAMAHDTYMHVITSKQSRIHSLHELAGKRIAVGPRSSGTELNVRALLRSVGLTYQDFIRVEYVSFNEAVDLMLSDQIDVIFQASGLDSKAIRRLSLATEVNFLPVSAQIIERMGSVVYEQGVIPAGIYTGQVDPVPTVVVPNLLMTHASVSDGTVYALTRAYLQSVQGLRGSHKALETLQIESRQRLTDLPLPWHPGALRYYREMGM